MRAVIRLSGWQESTWHWGAEQPHSCRWPVGNPGKRCTSVVQAHYRKSWAGVGEESKMERGILTHQHPPAPLFYFKYSIKPNAVWLVLIFFSVSFCAGLTLFSYHLEAVQPFLCSVKLQLINSGGSQLTEHRTKLVLLFSSYLRRLGMAAQGGTVGSSKDYPKCAMSWADRSWLWEMCLRDLTFHSGNIILWGFPLFQSSNIYCIL